MLALSGEVPKLRCMVQTFCFLGGVRFFVWDDPSFGVPAGVKYGPLAGRSATVAVEVDPVGHVVALFPISPGALAGQMRTHGVEGMVGWVGTVVPVDIPFVSVM